MHVKYIHTYVHQTWTHHKCKWYYSGYLHSNIHSELSGMWCMLCLMYPVCPVLRRTNVISVVLGSTRMVSNGRTQLLEQRLTSPVPSYIRPSTLNLSLSGSARITNGDLLTPAAARSTTMPTSPFCCGRVS